MNIFHSIPEPFSCIRKEKKWILENRYLECIHDEESAGSIVSAVVKNGSGKNMFAAPQVFQVTIFENDAYVPYRAAHAETRIAEHDGNPVLEFQSRFYNSPGQELPGLTLQLNIEYTPWGQALFHAEVVASRRIDHLRLMQVGSLWFSQSMDTLAVQERLIQAPSPYGGSTVKNWIHLEPDNYPAYHSRWVPLSMLICRRGVEGFQFLCGANPGQWESIPGSLPGFQLGYVAWNNAKQGYEMRIGALDTTRDDQYLDGTLHFEFSLAFPFVREKILPLQPCSGLLRYDRPFDRRWPESDDMDTLNAAGYSLLRLHNDGNAYNNGIFWRSCSYPPYPPDEMTKMERTLQLAKERKINVVPYFSLHEFHPDSPGFAEHAEEWGRIAAAGDRIIPSCCAHGYFGYQMCLRSGWFRKRRDTIDEVLGHHRFNGVYYDWCEGIECMNPGHGAAHWDICELLEMLAWSHKRIGDEGALYIHLTGNPNLIAGNMSSLVITEECGGSIVKPEMFSPHAHFMNIVPRQVNCMLRGNASESDYRRYALCALLHHATVSSCRKTYTDFYAEYRTELKQVSRFSRYTAPGEQLCGTDHPQCGMSVYWNEIGETMSFLVNLSEKPERCHWHYNLEGLENEGITEIPPLALKILHEH